MEDCSNSSAYLSVAKCKTADALELLQSWTKPSIFIHALQGYNSDVGGKRMVPTNVSKLLTAIRKKHNKT